MNLRYDWDSLALCHLTERQREMVLNHPSARYSQDDGAAAVEAVRRAAIQAKADLEWRWKYRDPLLPMSLDEWRRS